MNRIAFVGISLALLTASETWGQAMSHNYRVTETRVAIPVEAGTQLVHEITSDSLVRWVLAPLSADRLQSLVREYRPDPIVTGLSIDPLTVDTVCVSVRVCTAPRCGVEAKIEGTEFKVRGFLRVPATADFYLRAGEYYASLGNHGRAIDQFRKALALDPEDLRPYLAAARSRIALGQTRLALFNARRALADPTLAREAREILRKLGKPTPGEMLPPNENAPRQAGNASPREWESAIVTATDSQKPAEDSIRTAAASFDQGDRVQKAAFPHSQEERFSEASEAIRHYRFPVGRAFATSLLLAAGIVAPFGFVYLRLRKIRSVPKRSAKDGLAVSDFEQARNDVFEYLLRESMRSAETMRIEEEEGPEETAEEPDVSAGNLGEPPDERTGQTTTALDLLLDRSRKSERALRSDVESIYALASRGLTVAEIARRLGLGKEEVRLALRVRRGSAKPPVSRSRRPKFELVEELEPSHD